MNSLEVIAVCSVFFITANPASAHIVWPTTSQKPLFRDPDVRPLMIAAGTGFSAQLIDINATLPSGTNTASSSSLPATIVVPPTIAKAFAVPTIPLHGTVALTFSLSNPNTGTSLSGIEFTDMLPSGLAVSTPNGVTGSCGGGIITAPAGLNSIRLSDATLGPNASCSFTLVVIGRTAGTQNNATSVVISTQSGNGGMASATITVLAPPTITKAFGATTIALNESTPLTFAISNRDLTVPLTGITFLDDLPAGLAISTPNGQTGECGGGTISAVPGSHKISLSNAILGGGSACIFAVKVTGIMAGLQTNTFSVTSLNAGTSDTASASIMVQPAHAYQLGYASNLNIGDSFVNLTNSGSQPFGNICVNVYTFDATQNLVSCCSCPISPNGLKNLSAQGDLISNTLTVAVPVSITIKLVATAPIGGACNASTPAASNLAEGMLAWGTTIHSKVTTPSSYVRTEVPFLSSYLSPGALNQFTTLCRFIQGNGSGYGICKSCRAGALGAVKN